jgi:hypothetical protein
LTSPNGDCTPQEEQYKTDSMKDVLIGVLARRDLPKYFSRTLNPREFIDFKEPDTTTMKSTG